MLWKIPEPKAWHMPTPPMPEIQPAQLILADAHEALLRAGKAWNRAQLEDAMRSARHFLDLAQRALEKQNAAH